MTEKDIVALLMSLSVETLESMRDDLSDTLTGQRPLDRELLSGWLSLIRMEIDARLA
jgi:hypothetical protein